MTAKLCAPPLALAHRAGDLPIQTRCVRGLLPVGAAIAPDAFDDQKNWSWLII